jgi:hypothetical protein
LELTVDEFGQFDFRQRQDLPIAAWRCQERNRRGGDRVWIDRRRHALAIISVANGLGSKLSNKFAAINTSLK